MLFRSNKYKEVIDLIKLSKFNDVITILLSNKNQCVNDPIFYNLLGFAYDSISKTSDAKKNYLKSLELDSSFYEARFNLAVLNYKTHNYTEAEELFNQLIKIYKDDYNSYYNLGIIKFELKQYDLAINFFKIACSYNPNFYGAYNHLAKAYEELQKYDYAIFYYEKANSVNSEDLNLSFNLKVGDIL